MLKTHALRSRVSPRTESTNSSLSSLVSLYFHHARHCRLYSQLPISFRFFSFLSIRFHCCHNHTKEVVRLLWTDSCDYFSIHCFLGPKTQKRKSFYHAKAVVNCYRQQNQQGQTRVSNLEKQSIWRTCYRTVYCIAGTSYLWGRVPGTVSNPLKLVLRATFNVHCIPIRAAKEMEISSVTRFSKLSLLLWICPWWSP